jgi:LmbE family N-acetylglucosaminyl deacetylase
MIVREATKLARFRRLMPEVEPHTVRRLFYYMLPDDVLPTFVVDVSDHRQRLEAAISAYASQMQIRRGERRVLDMLMLLRQHAGLRIHAELGEGFLSVEPLSGPAESLMRI